MPATIDMTALDKLKALGPAGAAALDKAVKSTARKGRGIIVEEIASIYKVDQKIASKAIRVPTGTAVLTAEIRIKGDRLPLIGFAPQPNMPFMGGARPAGVSVDITTRRMVRQSKANPWQYAFIARMASGHVGVFQRSGNFGRVPRRGLVQQTETGFSVNAGKTAKLERIEEMFTGSVAQMEQSQKVQPQVTARLNAQLQLEAEKAYGKAVNAIFKESHTQWVWSEWAKS